jgi:hypothetical protein
MRLILFLALAAFTLGLFSPTEAQEVPGPTKPQSPGAPSKLSSSTPSFSKELLLIWGYQLHGYPVPDSMSKIAASPEAQRVIPEGSLKQAFKKHLNDNRFQAGWNGLYPGTSKRADIVNLMGLPDYTEARDFITRWLYRNRKSARTVVFEFFSGEEDSSHPFADGSDFSQSSGRTEDELANRDPQITRSIRIIPKEVTFATQVREQVGPPESISFSSNAGRRWKYLRGILVEFKGDQQEVERIIIRENDVLRID